jgi:hypothetical protein
MLDIMGHMSTAMLRRCSAYPAGRQAGCLQGVENRSAHVEDSPKVNALEGSGLSLT